MDDSNPDKPEELMSPDKPEDDAPQDPAVGQEVGSESGLKELLRQTLMKSLDPSAEDHSSRFFTTPVKG